MIFLINGIDIGPLLKARDTFERFRRNLNTEQEKAGAIQSFEFCYELAWKTMKRFLAQKGVEVRSPRDAFREAALNHLISDPKQWFIFIEKRNTTTHAYNEDILEDIVGVLEIFSKSLDEFIRTVQNGVE